MSEVTGCGRQVRVELLGPVRAWLGGRAVLLGPPQRQLVLAVLAMRAGTVLTRDELVDAIWEQAPDRAVGGLHKHVSALRAALDPGHRGGSSDVVATACGGYALLVPAGAVDAAVFGRHRAAARQAAAAGDLAAAERHLRAALGLWRGAALSGLPGPWARAGRQRLAEARLTATAERNSIRLQLGLHAELIDELTSLTALHPLREELWYQLMLALYRSGYRTRAMTAFHDARHALRDQLAIPPGPALRRLCHKILCDDPDLAVGQVLVPAARN